jgi:hypothetical protein
VFAKELMMARGSRSGSYVDYDWKSYTAFRFDAKPGPRSRRAVKYSITPTVDWTGAPRVFSLRTQRSAKDGTIVWTLA